MDIDYMIAIVGGFSFGWIAWGWVKEWLGRNRLSLSDPEFGELIAIRSDLFKGEGGIVLGTYGGKSPAEGFIVIHNAFAPDDSTHVRASSYLGRIVCGYVIRRESIPEVLRYFANGWDMSNVRR